MHPKEMKRHDIHDSEETITFELEIGDKICAFILFIDYLVNRRVSLNFSQIVLV